MNNSIVVCPKCGNQVTSTAKFCPACGQKMIAIDIPQVFPAGGQGDFRQQQQYQQPNQQQQYYQQGKSKLAAGLLGIFLGHLGIHNFYLGFTGKAVGQLILSIIGYITLIFFIGWIFVAIAGIWGLIEGIMILAGTIRTDAKGIPLRS